MTDSIDHHIIATAAQQEDIAITFCTGLSLMEFLLPAVASQMLTSRNVGDAVLAWTFTKAPDTVWESIFRMPKHCFFSLLEWLLTNTNLGNTGRFVKPKEKLLLFLYIVCQGHTVRSTAYQFHRAYETVHRLVYKPQDKYP